MSRAEGFHELVAPPGRGRVFKQSFTPSLGDCAPTGRIRLDAIARWLQDVAYFDVADAGVAASAVWVVRRSRIHVTRFPRFGEPHEAATFCSGFGRMWAERRTSIVRLGEDRADVEAVSLWVHLDPATRRPVTFTEQELAIYGESAGERRVTARLRHPAPPAVDGAMPWRFRAADCDVAGHVNNAAYWQVLEEELVGDGDLGRIDVEMEFRSPAQPGDKRVICEGRRRWIIDPTGEVHASIVIA